MVKILTGEFPEPKFTAPPPEIIVLLNTAYGKNEPRVRPLIDVIEAFDKDVPIPIQINMPHQGKEADFHGSVLALDWPDNARKFLRAPSLLFLSRHRSDFRPTFDPWLVIELLPFAMADDGRLSFRLLNHFFDGIRDRISDGYALIDAVEHYRVSLNRGLFKNNLEFEVGINVGLFKASWKIPKGLISKHGNLYR